MGVGAFSPNGVPIHSEGYAMLAFVGLELVPLPVTERSGGSGLVSGCYPSSAIVDVE